jgi:hypothetical protein
LISLAGSMTAHTPVATALRLKTTSYFLCTLVSHLSVKDHAFCRNPVVVGFWWRGVPATSFAPVLTTALYVIPLCRELVRLEGSPWVERSRGGVVREVFDHGGDLRGGVALLEEELEGLAVYGGGKPCDP